ncbi:esterase [Lithospermum erythrorhizon]|uniref:Esterase n=1 Tax=Lithospermum erythrorhizon TaxID=34254 RepID=A0AAV3Q399_LITER
MREGYVKAKSNEGYLRLLGKSKVIGTWDDHDYGLNDAGKEFVNKVSNQKLLLDFLDEPQDSPRRKQAGVYASYVFGPVGRQVKVILLDTRYHRDPISSDGTILGAEQWRWLERELNSPKTALTVIGSSIQVISNLSASTRPLFSTESWGRFPKERAHLFKLLSETKREGVIFISGDVHFGEISRYDGASGYPIYDITASGITQGVEKVVPSPLHLIVRFLAWLTPTTMREMGNGCRHKSCTYGKPNFGTIEIDWGSHPVGVKLEVRDTNGAPVMSKSFPLSHLQFQEAHSNLCPKKGNYQRHCTLEVDLAWIIRYRLAILFFFTVTVLLLLLAGLIYAVVSFALRLNKAKFD